MKDEIKSLNHSNASFSESTKGKKTYKEEHWNKCAILGLHFPFELFMIILSLDWN